MHLESKVLQVCDTVIGNDNLGFFPISLKSNEIMELCQKKKNLKEKFELKFLCELSNSHAVYFLSDSFVSSSSSQPVSLFSTSQGKSVIFCVYISKRKMLRKRL